MALFDQLNDVDNQVSVEVLLDETNIAEQLIANDGIAVVEEEEEQDVFQCGKCKRLFTSFPEFFLHKKTSCESLAVVNEDIVNDLIYSEIAQDSYAEPTVTLDSEFLSFDIDQDPQNIAATSQELCETYLTNPINFEDPSAIDAEVVPLTTNYKTIGKQNGQLPDYSQNTNAVTMSVIGGIEDQIEAYDGRENDVVFGKLKCLYCDKSFTKNFDLTQHLRSHTGERPFQCIVCGRAFAQKSNVKKHMVTHKVWPICGSKLPSMPLSKENIEMVETNYETAQLSKSYMCQYCPEVFTNFYELKTHLKIHTHQKVYRCIQKNCNLFFTDLDIFLGHTMTHDKDAQYHCHVCNKEFSSLDDLGTHQYAHSLPTSKYVSGLLTCKKCKSKFTSVEALERHMVLDSHTHPCPTCQKVFLCSRALRRHIKIHSSSLSFKCPHCNKGFKTEQYLGNHLVIHSTEKPFACEHCPATFNRRDKLSRHNLIHETFKKYTCPFNKHLGCLKTFNRKDKLKRHLLTHGIMNYTCACSRVFHKQEQLRRHEKICPKATKNKLAKTTQTYQKNSTSSKGLDRDNMSTIEIVVLPVDNKSFIHEKQNNSTIRVTFPVINNEANAETSQSVLVSQNVPGFKNKI